MGKDLLVQFVSDTHNMHRDVPVMDGIEILVVCGDITRRGEMDVIEDFSKWAQDLPCKVICIAGNHDLCFDPEMPEYNEDAEKILRDHGVRYLQDDFVELSGIKFYGSPWTPRFGDWAFNVERGPDAALKWSQIPDDTDVLITHGPPFGILDTVMFGGKEVGCEALRDRVLEVKPKVHAFGHIHEGYGALSSADTTFLNAAILDIRYRMTDSEGNMLHRPMAWDFGSDV